MRRYLLAFLLLLFTAWAANLKLYLKDGSYHVVREYQVQSDRVHFYSVERSQWEDIPLDLVDLRRTEAEVVPASRALCHLARIPSHHTIRIPIGKQLVQPLTPEH